MEFAFALAAVVAMFTVVAVIDATVEKVFDRRTEKSPKFIPETDTDDARAEVLAITWMSLGYDASSAAKILQTSPGLLTIEVSRNRGVPPHDYFTTRTSVTVQDLRLPSDYVEACRRAMLQSFADAYWIENRIIHPDQ